MSNRVQTLSFTTASIAASGSLQTNQNVGPNWISILKVKITPSTSTSALRAEFYTKNTFLAANRIGGYSVSVNGPVIDPMEDVGAGPVDRGQLGFIMPYDDNDGTGQIHLLIYNDHTSAQTYDVVITWEPRMFMSAGTGIAISPGNVGHDIQIISHNLSAGSNITFSAAGGALTIASGGAANVRRTMWFDLVDIISGSAYDSTFDNQSVVVLSKLIDSEVGFGFRVDDDFVASGDLSLIAVGASLLSPGTNMKLSLKARWKANNSTLSAYTTDTFSLTNNTAWRRDEATSNIIAGGIGNFAANDHIEFRVLRDTSYASAGSAQADYAVQRFGIEYTSLQ